jgi:hypothetical protein
MRINNRELLLKSARDISPKLGNLLQNDVDLAIEDIRAEIALCMVLSDAIANYAQALNHPGNFTQEDPKDDSNESN